MGILEQAQVPTIDAYQWAPTTSQSTGFDATKVADTPDVTAQTWTGNQFDMNAPDSSGRNGVVEDRLGGLLSKGSKLQTLARTGAMQQANSRGLMNSSIAAGAGEKAAIESALPIAQQDASAFNQVGLANQASTNRSDSENTRAVNDASTFNATLDQQRNVIDQATQTQADQFTAAAANDFATNNQNAINTSAKDFAAAKNEASLQNAGNALKALITNAEETLSQYSTDVQRKTALDGIASSLVQAALREGVFATQEAGANWLQMIGDLYPDMGLSVIDQLADNASASVA